MGQGGGEAPRGIRGTARASRARREPGRAVWGARGRAGRAGDRGGWWEARLSGDAAEGTAGGDSVLAGQHVGSERGPLRRLTGSRKGWERGRKQKERRRSGGAGNLLSVFSMSGVRVISGHSLTL